NSPYNTEDRDKQIPKTMPKVFKNLPHNTKGVQEKILENSLQCQKCPRTNTGKFTTQWRRCSEYKRIHQSAKSAKNKCREIHYITLKRIYHTMPKVFKNKHQKIHYSTESAKGQTPENSSHNTEGVKNKHKNLSQCPRTNAREFTTQCEGVQEHEGVQEYQRIHHIAESAQGQMPENLLHNAEGVQKTNTRKFKNSSHNMKVFKNTREFITVLKVPRTNTREFTTQCQGFKIKH
ncbi:6206_t:CDS:2, partial [Gigaspora rosea]